MPGESELQRDGAVRIAVCGERELRVLLVEDSPADAELVERALRHGGFRPVCERVQTEAEMRAALERDAFDVVLAGASLPSFGAPAALAVFEETGKDLPFLIVSAAMGEEAVVAAMKRGAHDYIAKDDLGRLGAAVERELSEAAQRRRRRAAEQARGEEALVAAALARVSRELIGALDTPLLLDGLCRVTADVLACDTSHTLLHEPVEDVFVPIAGYGATAEEREIARVVKVPRAIMTVLLERLEGDDVAEVRTIPREAVSLSTPLRGAQLCMPLRHDGAVVGIQVASRRERGEPFSAVERRIGKGIGELASLALDHARALEELERASRIKSEFVATVSHELRTPLNVVVGYTDLLIDGAFGALNDEQIDTLRRISARARGLLELINATLDLSNIEAGRLQLEMVDVEVWELLATLRAEMAEWHPKAEVELRWEIEADVPRMRTDAAKLKVILKNLITNAVKFTERGSVTVHAAYGDGAFHFDVRDTGIGIPNEAVPIVFEPFRQLDSSSTRKHGGVGLGLYIVRRLVEMVGGTISVESRVGQGSRFRVSIPHGVRSHASHGK